MPSTPASMMMNLTRDCCVQKVCLFIMLCSYSKRCVPKVCMQLCLVPNKTPGDTPEPYRTPKDQTLDDELGLEFVHNVLGDLTSPLDTEGGRDSSLPSTWRKSLTPKRQITPNKV